MEILHLRSSTATATVSRYGAQVLSFLPQGQPDVLWGNTPEFLNAAYANTKALRGGVPLCWPWFLAHPTQPQAPSHGLGRLQHWQLVEQTENALQMQLELDGATPHWPHATRGVVKVELTDALHITLTTTNLSETPFRLTQALHSYLRVGDITRAAVHGTGGLTQRHVSRGDALPPAPEPFTFDSETESLVSPTHTLVLHDPVLQRRVTVRNQGSSEMVIWNPWVAKAATLDMPADDYRHMLCLEAATLDNAPTLQPGESFTLGTHISALPMMTGQ